MLATGGIQRVAQDLYHSPDTPVQGYLGYMKPSGRESVGRCFLFQENRGQNRSVSVSLEQENVRKRSVPVFLKMRPVRVQCKRPLLSQHPGSCASTYMRPTWWKMLALFWARKCARSILRGGKRYEAKKHSQHTEFGRSAFSHG